MSLALLPVVALAASAVYAAGSALWRRYRRPAPPVRTEADVLADAAIARECRHFAQALDDHDRVWAIWPDAHRAARIADTQHRLDRRKENGQ
ncbi:hypothetical protein SAMN05444921_12167 [Streptomyces wuyuanensis]|uniref:Uncharacterized protein n=1 Tax=Streptomyces wuyuanensis TaxID=1196353 RepID=A0A1G9ZCL5_9ACTN|nr:hypothetical protein SAMN05444921_12167 [Streptomyces wuyuanensis]